MHISQHGIALTEVQYLWEREALEFVHHQCPIHEPYRPWSNFAFIAADAGSN